MPPAPPPREPALAQVPRADAHVVLAYLERDEPSPQGTALPLDHRYVAGLARFGRPWLVLAAREAAALVLPVWEERNVDVPEPRRALAAIDRWLACPCQECAGFCYGCADPLGRPEDRHWAEDVLVAAGRPVSSSELAALDSISCAALAPSSDDVEGMVAGALELAGRALAPESPESSNVRARIWQTLIDLARAELMGRPTRRLGPSPVAQMQAIEAAAVQPAFDEVVRSRALAERLRTVRSAAMRPIGGRAEALFTHVHGESPRQLTREARGDGWPEDGRLVGSTLVIEAVESFPRAAHPLAGVLLVTIVYEIRGSIVRPHSRAAYFDHSRRQVRDTERPLSTLPSGELRRTGVLDHVLDALTDFDQFGAP